MIDPDVINELILVNLFVSDDIRKTILPGRHYISTSHTVLPLRI